MNKNIEELLGSDDEFPMDYSEESDIPAYQIDSRFDVIRFKWLDKAKLLASKTESKDIMIPLPSQLHHKPIINQGVLNKHDLFCIKSIEGLTGDSTFIWLINFLLYKDIQANYLFLKSCLVSCK